MMQENNALGIDVAMKRSINPRLIELAIWTFFALIISGKAVFLAFVGMRPIDIIDSSYIELVFAFFVLMFPVLFELIFGRLPLESLRSLQKRNSEIDIRVAGAGPVGEPIETDELFEFDAPLREGDASSPKLNSFRMLAGYAADSRRLSYRLFNRAGVYLLVGVLVAFSGLAFFYVSTTATTLTSQSSVLQILVSLAPKFGVLFFIEIVAFFFLRQYRAAMDEFRYYEALKRHREEALALVQLLQETGKPINPLDLLKHSALFSRAGVLEKGQSSELIESRKLEKNELDLLEKVIEVVSRSKR